jgi:hypothetical protein
MASTLTDPTPPPKWYLGFIAGVYVLALLGLAAGLLGLYLNNQSATKQAECFQSFADRFSTVSTEVRAAQVKVDRVESKTDRVAARRETAFQKVLTLILAGDTPEAESIAAFKALQETTADLAEARDKLVQARSHLQVVRQNHPIPEAPEDGGRCRLLGN